jgi:hypothetical protein
MSNDDEQVPKMNLKFKTTQATHDLEVPEDITVEKVRNCFVQHNYIAALGQRIVGGEVVLSKSARYIDLLRQDFERPGHYCFIW